VFCDLLLPLVLAGGRRPGPIFWTIFGGLLAIARFGTIFCITLLVQAPAVAYAFLVPGLTIHGVFGLMSGFVSYHLLRGLDRNESPPPEEPA
jgi:membrane protein implicated in regulation of membrane protease activity